MESQLTNSIRGYQAARPLLTVYKQKEDTTEVESSLTLFCYDVIRLESKF